MSVQKDSCQGNHKVPRPKSCNEVTRHMQTPLVPRPHSAGDVGRWPGVDHPSTLNPDLGVKDEDMVQLLEVRYFRVSCSDYRMLFSEWECDTRMSCSCTSCSSVCMLFCHVTSYNLSCDIVPNHTVM